MSKDRAVRLHIRNRKQDEILLLGPGNEPVLLVKWDGQTATGVAPTANEHTDESGVTSATDEPETSDFSKEEEVEVTTTGTPKGPEPKDESREPKKDAPKVDRNISGEPDVPDAQDVADKAVSEAEGMSLIEPKVKSEDKKDTEESKTDEDDPSFADDPESDSPDDLPTEVPPKKPKSGDATDHVDQPDEEDDKFKKGGKFKGKKPKKDGMKTDSGDE